MDRKGDSGQRGATLRGDPIPALVVRRSDPPGRPSRIVLHFDPELESTTPLGERRHGPARAAAENAFELEDGETVLAVATPGSIGVCPGCGDVREVVVGINGDLHDHHDGSDHAGTYEVGPALRLAVTERDGCGLPGENRIVPDRKLIRPAAGGRRQPTAPVGLPPTPCPAGRMRQGSPALDDAGRFPSPIAGAEILLVTGFGGSGIPPGGTGAPAAAASYSALLSSAARIAPTVAFR